MRINRRRPASASLELAFLLPVILIGILVAQYISVTALHRGEVVTHGRSAAVAQAFNDVCAADRAGAAALPSVAESADVTCQTVDGEKGLHQELPYWTALRRAATPWPEINRDVEPEHIHDIVSYGTGQARFTAPPFLEGMSEMTASEIHRLPDGELWTHYDNAFQAGHDPILFQELRKSGTYRLFPNVFPSAN